MLIIRMILDGQSPNLETILNEGGNQIFDLKVLGFTVQRAIVEVYSNGGFNIKFENEILFYVLPFILATCILVIFIILIKKIKKITEKWKI